MNNYNCYIHIPFCRSKCKYCRFASFSVLDDFKVEKYVGFLCKEINSVFSLDFLSSRHQSISLKFHQEQISEPTSFFTKEGKNKEQGKLDTLYFGGGTPAILGKKQLEKIFQALREKFIFSENIEITMETTLEEINLEKLNFWQKLGINRISIGIQSLNKKALENIGRSKKSFDLDEKLKIVENFTREKKVVISVDFIIGLPFVKYLEILENIKYILEKYKFINHISVYMLEDYYLPGKKNEKFEQIIYPKNWKKNSISEDEIGKEYLRIKKFLEKKGFFRYEFSNFAKLETINGPLICKHNFGYWTHKETVAFGLGASSFLGNSRFKNSEDFSKYYEGKGKIGEKLTRQDLFLEKIMFSLRTSGIEKKDTQELDRKNLKYFLENGYLKDIGEKIILDDKGILYLDYILERII